MDETTEVGSDAGAPVSEECGPRDNAFNGTVAWAQLDIDEAAADQDHLIAPEERFRIAHGGRCRDVARDIAVRLRAATESRATRFELPAYAMEPASDRPVRRETLRLSRFAVPVRRPQRATKGRRALDESSLVTVGAWRHRRWDLV